MTRSFHILAVLILMAAVGGVYQLKHQVEAEQRRLEALHKQYRDDQKAIRVLRAEWSYLNSPDYLQQLVDKHLDLEPTRSTQVAGDVRALPIQTEGIGRLAGLGDVAPRPKPQVVDGLVPFWPHVNEERRP